MQMTLVNCAPAMASPNTPDPLDLSVPDRGPGSVPLASAQQDRFCRLVAEGWKPQAAYKQAFQKPASWQGTTGSVLMRRVPIMDRINWIKQHEIAAGTNGYDGASRVLRELSRVAFSDLRDVMEWGPRGVVIKDSDQLTRKAAAMVGEVEAVPGKYGTRMRIKAHPKLSALHLLAEHYGLVGGDKDGGERGPTVIVVVPPQLSREEWLKQYGGVVQGPVPAMAGMASSPTPIDRPALPAVLPSNGGHNGHQ